MFTLDLYGSFFVFVGCNQEKGVLILVGGFSAKMDNNLHAVSRASQIEERYGEHEIPCLRLSKIGCKVILQLVLQPLFSIPNVDVPQKKHPRSPLNIEGRN